MYQEEYEERGFPFRNFLLKLILIIILVFLLIWILPKFIKPNVKKQCVKDKNGDCLIETTTKDFKNSMEKIKKASLEYYTKEKLPKKNNTSKKLTLEEMINKKIIKELKTKTGQKYNLKDSYVKITKANKEYILKIKLKIGNKKDYLLTYLGAYSYCDNYLCEKVQNEDKKEIISQPTSIVPIVESNRNKNNKSHSVKQKTKTKIKTKTKKIKPSKNNKDTDKKMKEYLYEYKKNTGVEFSDWSSWSGWTKTDCNTEEINCNDNSITCLKKLQRYNHKEKVGTYDKKYTKTRSVLTKTGGYYVKSCTPTNYIVINNQTYSTSGNWVLVERSKEYYQAPNDTEKYHYEFVGANFTNCHDTCATTPSYYYNVYKFEGTMTKTSSNAPTVVNNSCKTYTSKYIPIYSLILKSETVTRKEPLYATVCYQSIKTRKVIKNGKTITKWSKYNDQNLLDDNWEYTDNKKQK